MTADPHTETNADLLKRLYAALKHNKSCSCGECCGGLNAADALAARLKAAERDLSEVREAASAVNNNAKLTDGEDVSVRVEDMDRLVTALAAAHQSPAEGDEEVNEDG